MWHDPFITRFQGWAERQDDLRAAIVVGSHARTGTPADAWSDLDLVMLTTDPARYLSETGWLEPLGDPLLSFLEGTAVEHGMERRVLFEGGHDVDFIPVALEEFRQMARQGWPPEIASVFLRGFRVVVDKDGLEGLLRFEPTTADQGRGTPTEAEFLNLCHDLLYHAVWTAKKLARGEHWTAKVCLDCGMKQQLLKLLEWQARARHGADYDTWHRGRFLERWADPGALAELRHAYAHYDPADLRRALDRTVLLAGRVGRDTAGLLAYRYPEAAEKKVLELIDSYV